MRTCHLEPSRILYSGGATKRRTSWLLLLLQRPVRGSSESAPKSSGRAYAYAPENKSVIYVAGYENVLVYAALLTE